VYVTSAYCIHREWKKKDKESKTETTKEGEQEEYKSSESYRIHT